MKMRRSLQTTLVFGEFLQDGEAWRYGYDISRNTGLKSGTLYPILMRLAERKLLETSWETPEVGKPPRHLYRLTPDGMKFARAEGLIRSASRVGRAAYGGARS